MNNFRNTPLKKSVLSIFKQGQLLTMVALTEKLKALGHTPNKSTLYRQINSFVENKIINKVFVRNSTYYEINASHHHHFSCTKCDQVICLKSQELTKLEKSILQLEENLEAQGHLPTQHSFSLSGLCQNCIQ